ncbi:hypothetical protein LguiB_009829 [Lonicera macranthoides]
MTCKHVIEFFKPILKINLDKFSLIKFSFEMRKFNFKAIIVFIQRDKVVF